MRYICTCKNNDMKKTRNIISYIGAFLLLFGLLRTLSDFFGKQIIIDISGSYLIISSLLIALFSIYIVRKYFIPPISNP